MISKASVTPRPWGHGGLTWELVNRPDMAVFHERMPPGAAETPHRHGRAGQVFFVLAGELTIGLDGADHRLGPWEALEIPPGRDHHVRNLSDQAVEFLAIAHPSTTGDRTESGDPA